MGILQLTAGVVLGAVFVASGLLKLRDPAWPATALAFGAPAWAVPVLPWVEIAVGVATGARLPQGAIGALVLLAMMSWLIVVHLRRGDGAPCACFGRATSARPVSPAHLVRNIVLAGLAVAVLL